jgi:hypothetical protein
LVVLCTKAASHLYWVDPNVDPVAASVFSADQGMKMTEQNDPVLRREEDVAIDPVNIQFDQAEYATPALDGPSCEVCQRPIDGEYYEIGGKLCCPSCRPRIEAAFRGGSRAARMLKALFFGSVASAAGAVLYYVILRATGYNLGLVAVVVGVMVGRAVRRGTGDRGGRFYQVLAIFLTYSAIMAMFAPMAFKVFVNQAKKQEQAGPEVAKAAKGAAMPEAQTKVANNAVTDRLSTPNVDDPANPASVPKTAANEPPALPPKKLAVVNDRGPARGEGAPAPQGRSQILLTLLVGSVFLIGLFYTVPIVVSVSDPLSGLIFSFALWEAWKANRGMRLSFNGPFRVSTKGSSGPEPEVACDGE